MTRGERLVMWLLDVSCRAREAAYAFAPTDARHDAWRRAEAKYARTLNAFAGPEPTDPEERDESWVTLGSWTREGFKVDKDGRRVDAYGTESKR